MTLVILLAPGDDGQAAGWADLASGEHGGPAPLETLAGRVAGDPRKSVCVAVPGEGAISRAMRLPMKRMRDLHRAAGLALDDAVATPIPGRVIALGAETGGVRLVSALPEDAVAKAISDLNGLGLDPDIVTVDHALLPAPADAGHVNRFDLGARTAVRDAAGAFTVEAAFAEELLQLAEAHAIETLGWDDVVPAEELPNFRAGALAKRRPLPDPRPYALAASLVLAAGIIVLAASLVDGIRYARAADRLEAQAQAAFTQAYPGTPIVDLERQLRGRRRGSDVSSRFLPLTAILADVLSERSNTSISSLAYGPGGELTAEIIFESFGDLEEVTSALSDRGVIAEGGNDARREDGAFVTRLSMRAA